MPNVDPIQLRLRKHVDVLAGLIGERSDRYPSAREAAQAYIRKRLADVGLAAVDQPFAALTRPALNLEVTLAGTKPGLPQLIVGAHYDTVRGTPGADDNASAVALLLELTAALAGTQHRRTVRCVFFDCEEPPHFGTPSMGSFHHARSLKEAGTKVQGMICLESLGYWPLRNHPSVIRPRTLRIADALFGTRHVVLVSDMPSIPFGLPFALRFLTSGVFATLPAALPRRFGIHGLSDHRNYWAHGFPALMLTNTAMFRNPHYHQPTDVPDTLDFARMTKLFHIIAKAVKRTCS